MRRLSTLLIMITFLMSPQRNIFADANQTVIANAPTRFAADVEFDVEPLNPALAFFQLEAQDFIKPQPAYMEGKSYVTYEVFITNVGNQAFKIAQVDVLDGDHPDKVLYSYDHDALIEMIKSFQQTNPEADQSLVLRPGVREVLYFMPEFKGRKNAPHKLLHKFTLQPLSDAGDAAQDLIMHAAPVEVNLAPPIVFGVPLRGTHWFAANGPSNTSIHRRAIIANHGVVYFPERFAIDFMQFGNNGKLYRNDPSKNESYFAYGADVHAVASGKVVAIMDGIIDNAPGKRDYPITLTNMSGNYVLIDIGSKRYAFYAHLMPKSIKVKRGDYVQKGQLLGKVGNSGNSDAPHLHFHVVDQPSILSAQGTPYAFDHFATESYKVPNPNADEAVVVYSDHEVARQSELVPQNAMVDFGAE